MDAEMEDKIVSLQVCIDEGHCFEIDKDSFDSESVCLNCVRCEYTKTVQLTKAQAKRINKLFDDENKLQQDILKGGSE